jgi:hypothetical protein
VRSKTLLLEYYREAPNDYDRMTTIILKDYKGEIVFQAEYKNNNFIEMLKPSMSDYNVTKEYKELKDIGIVTV